MSSPDNFDADYDCLQLVPMSWSPSGGEDPGSDDGILLQVWNTGGLLHSCLPIPTGSLIELVPGGNRIVQAQVTSCEPDDNYGFILKVSVESNHCDNWFPESNSPT